MIHIVRSKATQEQIDEMLQSLQGYIKLAVDTRLGILAGGGVMHADCEAELPEAGCLQEDIWGADWNPLEHIIVFESLINIRPRQANPSLVVLDSYLREQIEKIVIDLLGNP